MCPTADAYLSKAFSPVSDGVGVQLAVRNAAPVRFQVAPAMSGEWQCSEVARVLQKIINQAYACGKRDVRRVKGIG